MPPSYPPLPTTYIPTPIRYLLLYIALPLRRCDAPRPVRQHSTPPCSLSRPPPSKPPLNLRPRSDDILQVILRGCGGLCPGAGDIEV
jgi:hypothetical protein